MANKPYQDTTHLKVGNTYKDVIRTAKVQGTGYTDTCKDCDVTPTPDSDPSGADGWLGDDYVTDKGPRLWRPMDSVTARNTYTGPGGSKRRSDRY
jgi:hypothetical protein